MNIKEKRHITYQETTGFFSETMAARGSGTFSSAERRTVKPQILHPEKLPFRNQGETEARGWLRRLGVCLWLKS